MIKYELRDGETFIEEYIDNEGECVTIFEDAEGEVMHGWILHLDLDTAKFVGKAAALANMNTEEYVIMVLETEIARMIEEQEKRKAIEDISD